MFSGIICSLSKMNQEGPEGDEPDYHPEELQGQEGEMELFIVPPNPPRTGKKRARSRGKQTTGEQSQPSAQQSTASSSTSKLRSKVWLDFTKMSRDEDEVIVAICNHCSKQMSGKSANGTSHLARHLETQHKTAQATLNNFFIVPDTNEDGTATFKKW